MATQTNIDSANLYDVLGVAPNADMDELRRAFRSLARLLHPDANSAHDAAQRFALVAHAYGILSDPDRRLAYDMSRRAPVGTRIRNPQSTHTAPSGRGVLRGADVSVVVSLSIREAAFGAEVRIEVPRREACTVCLGTGVAPGGTSTQCPVCHGTGGTRTGTAECSHCKGSGVVGNPACTNCQGSGRRRGLTSLVVAIPPAVGTGTTLVLKGDGDVGPKNGPRGDLILQIDVRQDPVLRQSGIDILMTLPLSPHDAESGCTVEVPTLRGPKKLRIPPHTLDHTLLRIGGAGIRPHGSWHKGDQFVTVLVEAAQPDEAAE